MNSNNETIVNTLSGKIKGYCKDGVYVFKGIPYAAPPVGELRWLAPQPVKPWEGVRPAMEFGPICPQNEMPGRDILGLNIPGLKDENCLFLNVWTKDFNDAQRPVMIWLHGGAFIMGSGSQPMFPGRKLVLRGNVVFVSINYRLGVLGFINLKEITGGKIPATGCEGLLDQIAAIEWVRSNIKAFGGDPDNITVFGESAGAMSIGTLMSMPSAKGKFQKAILESGAANTVASLDEGVETAREFMKILGLKANDIEAIRSLSVKQLLSVQVKLSEIIRAKDGRITPFHPVVDGKVLPEIPIIAIRKGSASGIKTLAGSNLEEFKFFNIMEPDKKNLNETDLLKNLQSLIPHEYIPAILEVYRKALGMREESVKPLDLLTAIKTDIMFRMPCLNLVEAQCRNNQPAYNYLFTWKSPVMGGILGACHGLDVGFVFGNNDDIFCGSGPDADALTVRIQDAWFAFARTGDPSCKSLGKWEPYGSSRKTMILDKECRIVEAPYDEERSVWDQFKMTFTKPI